MDFFVRQAFFREQKTYKNCLNIMDTIFFKGRKLDTAIERSVKWIVYLMKIILHAATSNW